MRAQADRVTFAYAKVWDSAAHRELAQKLTAMAGLGFDSVFLVSGGTEAVEASLKIARQTAYARGNRSHQGHQPDAVLPRQHAGDPGSDGRSGLRRALPRDVRSNAESARSLTYRLPAGVSAEEYARRCAGPGGPDPRARAGNGPRRHPGARRRRRHGRARRTGRLLHDGPPDLRSVRRAPDLQRGHERSGRTGKFLAAHHWKDCRPDILALAKGVSGGYAPLGAVLTTDDMVRDLRGMRDFFTGTPTPPIPRPAPRPAPCSTSSRTAASSRTPPRWARC